MSLKGSSIGCYQVRVSQGGRGRDRSNIGYSYYGANTKQKLLCSALGIYVFEYGQKSSADKIIITWKNLVHHVGTLH